MKVTLGSVCPSSFAKGSSSALNKKGLLVSPYRQRIALEIYELFETLKLNDSDIRMSVNLLCYKTAAFLATSAAIVFRSVTCLA